MRTAILVATAFAALGVLPARADETITVRPREIDDVLVNPGVGFMTFQRFNGDRLNEGKNWTEGYPIVAQPFTGRLENDGYPATSLAYFRIYWKFLEPEPGHHRWKLIYQALKTAGERGQTLLLRVAPYGTGKDNDVPDWYRSMLGEEPELPESRWRTNPEDPRYVQHFGGLIRALGRRYDGHPLLESVDLAVVGPWGEGASADRLTRKTRESLVDCYLDTFRSTHLVMLLTDEKTNGYGLSKRAVGWRVDCLGDMGGFSESWCHMCDAYPQEIIRFGMKDAWQKAPVSFEACWVMKHWKDKGWDGLVYPYTFNADDFEPITGTVHQPPPAQQTFAAPGFVLCTFAPRMLDTHPEAIKVPYAHSNVQADEVLYYVEGRFSSRRGVEEASITLHPRGLPHGPHPGTLAASRDATRTDELAVMLDTERPLALTRQALALDDPDYPLSWME